MSLFFTFIMFGWVKANIKNLYTVQMHNKTVFLLLLLNA